MNLFKFLIDVNDERIVEAIRAGEARTSGEIRAYIASGKHPNPYPAAVRKFHAMGMTETRERNGILIYIAPRSQSFALVGDEAIHARCGESFWNSVRDEMTRAFKDESPTDAIVTGVTRVAELLAVHFPRQSDDRNELADTVTRGH